MKKVFFALCLIFILGSFGFLYFLHQVSSSHGSFTGEKIFVIEKGETTKNIALRLKNEKIISNKLFFLYYIFDQNLRSKIIAGEYAINSDMTIPEIAKIITQGKYVSSEVRVTFPEGLNIKKMSEKINEAGLPGDDFLKLASNADADILKKYNFISELLPGSSLEGFLFPDTYFFKKDSTGQEIISKMLDNFNVKLSLGMRDDIKNQNKSIFDIITMASVIEKEANNEQDRKIVSGIFWNRIRNGQALQSCATIGYLLGEDKKQYSFEDTRVASLYNTYLNPGLPKGPICNPGLASIEAAIYPQKTDYNYFLNDPETGQTMYAKTLDEHNNNKAKCGL